jgi:hypothetical protein
MVVGVQAAAAVDGQELVVAAEARVFGWRAPVGVCGV